MPFPAGHLIRGVLLLSLAIFLVSLLLVSAAIVRRTKRERSFRFLDAFRERSQSILEELLAGNLEYMSGLEQFRGMIAEHGPRGIESILVDYIAQPRYSPAIIRLAEDLGFIEAWQRQAGAGAKARGGRAKLLSRARRVRFFDRARAVRYLGQLAHHGSWRLLIEALDDPHKDVRETAARSLAAIGEPLTFPILVKRLEANLTSSKPIFSESALRLALGQFPLKLADQLRPLLGHACSQARLAGAQVLRQMLNSASRSASGEPGPDLFRLVWEKLACDDSPDVRAVAADLMAFMADEPSGSKLVAATEDEEWFVRLHAVRALGERESPVFPAVIARHLTDPHWRVREAAALALTASGPVGISELLRVFAITQDAYAREQIAEALEAPGVLGELASRCAGGDGMPERDALLDIVKMGRTAWLESWVRRLPAR